MTPGYKTTEFWLTTIASIGSLAVALGYVTPDQVSGVQSSVAQIIAGVIGIVSVVQYIRSRTALKVAGLQQNSQ